MTKHPVVIPILSNKNHNIKIDDVINGNDIITYDQAHGSNGELKKIENGNYDIITNGNQYFYQKNDS